MPLTPEEVLASEATIKHVRYFQEQIDKELAKGVYWEIKIPFEGDMSELTKRFWELLTASYLAAGWKEMRYENQWKGVIIRLRKIND